MQNKVKAKTFFTALREFHDHPQKVRKYFKDNRITQSEKKILEGWYLLRDGKSEQIVELFEKIPAQTDELVESQRNLVLGLALNNLSRFTEAAQKVESAARTLKNHDLPYYLYIAQSNLFNINLNLKNMAGMRKSLHELRAITAQNKRQEVIYLLLRMKYFSFCGKYHFANRQIALIEQKKNLMNESIVINFMTSKFMHEVRCQDLNKANRTLNEMKKFRKFHFNANFKFMRMMLDHLMAGKPLYVYQHDFDHSPMLFHQIKVIQLLEEANPAEAETHWNKLQEIQPGIYGRAFQYDGDPCLFSLCLKRHDKKISMPHFQMPLDMPKEKWLYTLLQEIDHPIRKEDLLKLIWGKNESDKDDLNKLKVLISRTRDKYGIEISYKKGCYQLIRHSQLKKSA